MTFCVDGVILRDEKEKKGEATKEERRILSSTLHL